jgi:hypothetical protein
MRVITPTLIWLSLLLPLSLNQDKGWQGIVLLHSTRFDVEKLIGRPITPNGSTYDPSSFDPAVDRVFVQYSTGYCTKERQGGYDVPSGTVILIGVTWSKKQDFCELKIDENKFEKSRDAEIQGLVYYSNMDEGIIYAVEDGKLKRTDFFPGKRYSNLLCSRQDPKTSSRLVK